LYGAFGDKRALRRVLALVARVNRDPVFVQGVLHTARGLLD
jgi:hypothetical protein